MFPARLSLLAAYAVCGAVHAAPNAFVGIYSSFDPVANAPVDLLKVQDVFGELEICTSADRRWSCVEASTKPELGDRPGLFKAAPSVKALGSPKLGYLYSAPAGASTRVGTTPTGHITEMVFGIEALQRRPLRGGLSPSPTGYRQAGQEVHLHAANYSGDMLALAVARSDAPAQRTELDTVNGYGVTNGQCCMHLPPPDSKAAASMIVTYRVLPDGKETAVTVPLPSTATPSALWVVMHADRKVELVPTEGRYSDPGSSNWPGKVKGMPALPPARRATVMAQEIAGRKQYIANLVQRRDSAQPGEVPNDEMGIEEVLHVKRQQLRFLETMATCGKDLETCARDAQQAARGVGRED